LNILAAFVLVIATNRFGLMTPAMNTFLPDHGQTVLDAINSVGYFEEITPTKGLLIAIECAIIAGGCLTMIPGREITSV